MVDNAFLDVEAVVLGAPPEMPAIALWQELCEETARILWAAQTDRHGELQIALIDGPAPTSGGPARLVVGAYSPETRAIVVFTGSLAEVRGRTQLRQLLRTLAHEVTHAVQHRAFPGLRPGRQGSITHAPGVYREDPLEREARFEEAAFDHALFSATIPTDAAERAAVYRTQLTPRLLELIDALEHRDGV